MGLALAVGVVLLATALTLGTTWHLADKAKHGVERGIEGIEHVASKGKEKLFGQEPIHREPTWKWFGRHEALQKLRDALGVESGKPIGDGDYDRLEELIKLDQYSHSPGFWESLKEKGDDMAKKVKSTMGMHSENDKRLREALDSDGFAHSTVTKLREYLGVEEGKPLGQETMEKLKELLGGEKRKVSMWEKGKEKLKEGKEKLKASLHMGAKEFEDRSEDFHESVKEKFEKVKEKVGLAKDSESYIEEAKGRVAETEDILDKATEARRKERKAGEGRR